MWARRARGVACVRVRATVRVRIGVRVRAGVRVRVRCARSSLSCWWGSVARRAMRRAPTAWLGFRVRGRVRVRVRFRR